MGKRTPIILVFTLIIVGAIVGLLVWKWDGVVEKIAEKQIDAERRTWLERTRKLEAIITEMQQGKEPKPLLPTERLSQVFGPSSLLVKGVTPSSMKCPELEEALRAFCRYLDAGETFRSQKTYHESWALFSNILLTLERRLPTISAEAYRPSVIVENAFYFFRLLGKEKIDILREVLKYEADLAEPLMGILYYWLMSGRQCDKLPPSSSTVKVMYHYAGFFLNTLGGQSYLYRRDSKIRLLTIYYAVLVVHETNLQGFNEVGLDLRFFLPLIFDELQRRNDLLYLEEYLQTLSNLQIHYFRSALEEGG